MNALQAGMEKAHPNGGAKTVRVTQLYVTVNIRSEAIYTVSNGPTGMNELTRLDGSDGSMTSFTYDDDLNMRTRGSWTYDWNKAGLMTRALLSGAQRQAYLYDGLGRRAKVEGTTSSTWTVSIFGGQDVLFERTNGGATTKYVYAAGLRIARIDCTSSVPVTCSTSYYLPDHEGSTRKVLASDRSTVFSTEYEPFGKPVQPAGTEARSTRHDRRQSGSGGRGVLDRREPDTGHRHIRRRVVCPKGLREGLE